MRRQTTCAIQYTLHSLVLSHDKRILLFRDDEDDRRSSDDTQHSPAGVKYYWPNCQLHSPNSVARAIDAYSEQHKLHCAASDGHIIAVENYPSLAGMWTRVTVGYVWSDTNVLPSDSQLFSIDDVCSGAVTLSSDDITGVITLIKDTGLFMHKPHADSTQSYRRSVPRQFNTITLILTRNAHKEFVVIDTPLSVSISVVVACTIQSCRSR